MISKASRELTATYLYQGNLDGKQRMTVKRIKIDIVGIVLVQILMSSVMVRISNKMVSWKIYNLR